MSNEEINEQELDRFEERYFGTMPEPVAAAFDAEMIRDAGLRGRYDLFVLSVRGIQSGGSGSAGRNSGSLRAQFRAIDRELDGKQVLVRSLFRPWMGWAATVLVLITVAGWLWLGRSDTPQQLAEEFALAEPGLPVLMGTSPQAMDAIMNAYKRNDLATAGLLLGRALVVDAGNDTLNYFSGVVDERSGDQQAALKHFAQVSASSVFKPRAEYRSALLSLRNGEIDRARQGLVVVAASDDVLLASKARDLLDRFNDL